MTRRRARGLLVAGAVVEGVLAGGGLGCLTAWVLLLPEVASVTDVVGFLALGVLYGGGIGAVVGLGGGLLALAALVLVTVVAGDGWPRSRLTWAVPGLVVAAGVAAATTVTSPWSALLAPVAGAIAAWRCSGAATRYAARVAPQEEVDA